MAVEVEARVATADDAQELAARLRSVEVDEVRASSGCEPLPVIIEAIGASSEAWAVSFDGRLAFVWGVVGMTDTILAGRTGAAWLLTTDLVERHSKAFWQYCLRELPSLLARWDVLLNEIDARHEKALRWARRLGFQVDEAPEPFGAQGLPFYAFRVTKGDLHV